MNVKLNVSNENSSAINTSLLLLSFGKDLFSTKFWFILPHVSNYLVNLVISNKTSPSTSCFLMKIQTFV